MTANRHLASFSADLNAAGSRTYRPATERELKRRLRFGMNVYDTVLWQDIAIKRLQFNHYRVSWGDKSERLGGKTATYALAVLLKRLGMEGGDDGSEAIE